MNLIEQFARHIEFCGRGQVADKEVEGNIFWGLMPDQPDNAVCVFSTDSGYGGSDDGARVQVVVRARVTRAAYELSQRIVEDLAEFDGYLAGDGARVQIEIINASAGLGVDEKRRDLYSSNFLVRYCNF